MEKKLLELININPESKVKYYKKGDIIQRKGDPNTKVFYVQKGLIRSYIIDEKGKEHIFMFAAEGTSMSDIESLEFNQITELYIDCVENSEIVELNNEDINYRITNKSQWKLKHDILNKQIASLQSRILMLMSESGQVRYESFLEQYPLLSNRIPLKMIASYLGIAPESLSRIRKEISKCKNCKKD